MRRLGLTVLAVGIIAIVGVAIAEQVAEVPLAQPATRPCGIVTTQPSTQPAAATRPPAIPKLVDLGSKSCIPCKKMAPVLDEVKREYAGRFDVEFIDVRLRENLPLARKYGVRMIPTQVFLSGEGVELWRHEGFLGKEQILQKWKELGHSFEPAETQRPEQTEPGQVDRPCCDLGETRDS